jgi:tetratricopeptide (TPR) repeat protein
MEPAALLAPPREPPPLRARADEVRQRLAEARARYKVGDQSAALTVARQALTGAQALGHPPLLAEALLRLGDIEMYSGTPEAEAHLVAAVRAAEAAQADRLKAQAANSLSFVVGYEKRRYQQGLDWSDFALAVLDRLGGDDAQSSLVHVNRGAVLLAQERTDEAAQSFERALALAAQAGLGQRAEAAGRLNLANARREQRRYPEAAAAYERAIQLFRETYGPRFPSIGMALHGLASTRVEQGDYDQARADFRRMLDQFRLVYGPEHRDTLRASSEAFEFEALADGAPGVLNEARALVATAGRTLGPEHEITAQTRLMLGRVLLGAGLSGEAARLLAPLVTSLESHLGPTDRFLIVPLFLLGSAELSLGQHEAARSHLDRALALGDAGSLRLSDRAALRFAAARAHADHAPERACALGREARELHHDLRAPPEQSRAAAIDDWLARRAAICSTPTSPASTRL